MAFYQAGSLTKFFLLYKFETKPEEVVVLLMIEALMIGNSRSLSGLFVRM